MSPRDEPATGRRADPLEAIAREPWRWDFFHALRCIESHHADLPRLGTARRPAQEPVRLGQVADLAFAPSSLAAVQPGQGVVPPQLQVRFFGLFGPNGPLPLHLTAYARERSLHKGDHTFARFADLFHHRLLLLFYRAWAQAQPTVSADRPDEDRFADFVGSLIGVGGPAWRGRSAAPDAVRLFFAGVLSGQSRHADGLQALIGGYLRAPVRVEPFAGRWMRLLTPDRTRLGGRARRRRSSAAQLGFSAVLGESVFDRQHHFRLHVGPLDAAGFAALLPTGTALPAVKSLVEQYLGHELGWDLQLHLEPQALPRCRLGAASGNGIPTRLGWSTWLGDPRAARPSVTLNPETMPAPH